MIKSVKSICALFFVATSMLICCVTSSFGAENIVLKHDDGTMESKLSETGGGHSILFECPRVITIDP